MVRKIIRNDVALLGVAVLICLYFLITASVAHAKTEDSSSFFDKTAQELLQEKITDDRIYVEAEYNSKGKVDHIRTNEDKIKSIVLEKFDPKNSSFMFNILYNDGKSELLSGKYVLYVEVPIATRPIKYGEVIQSIDVSSLKVKVDKISSVDIAQVSEVVGMQAKNYISKGSIVKKVDIANPPVIKNNDPVNIIYSSGSINLKTSGISMGAGAVGDMIKVKNSTSGVVLLGQIVNKNTVQVNGSDNE